MKTTWGLERHLSSLLCAGRCVFPADFKSLLGGESPCRRPSAGSEMLRDEPGSHSEKAVDRTDGVSGRALLRPSAGAGRPSPPRERLPCPQPGTPLRDTAPQGPGSRARLGVTQRLRRAPGEGPQTSCLFSAPAPGHPLPPCRSRNSRHRPAAPWSLRASGLFSVSSESHSDSAPPGGPGGPGDPGFRAAAELSAHPFGT